MIAAWPQPVSAQAWVGQMAADMARMSSLHACLDGKTIAPEEIAEAREPSIPLMRGFWLRAVAARQTAIANGSAPIGAKWLSGSVKTKAMNAAYLSDALSPTADLMLIEEPITFVRAGASPHVTGQGLWRVVLAKDPSKTIGFYKVDFLRLMFKWQIQSITAIPGEVPPEVRPYCDRPGDIEKAQARRSERAKR